MVDPVELAMKELQAVMSYHFKEPDLLRNALNFGPRRHPRSTTIRNASLFSVLSREWFRDSRSSRLDVREWGFQRTIKCNFNLPDIADQTGVLSVIYVYAIWDLSKEDTAALFEAIVGAVEIDGGSKAVESVMAALGSTTPYHMTRVIDW